MKEGTMRKLTGGQSDDNHSTTKDKNPDWDRAVLARDLSGIPDFKDGRVWADGIGDIVGTVSKGSSASGQDLEEGIQVLGLVVILRSAEMDSMQSLSFSFFTTLQFVDID